MNCDGTGELVVPISGSFAKLFIEPLLPEVGTVGILSRMGWILPSAASLWVPLRPDQDLGEWEYSRIERRRY